MSKYRAISELLAPKGNRIDLKIGTVIKVYGEDLATVEIAEMQYDDVRLRLTDDSLDNKLVVRPKVGSLVLVADLTGEGRVLTIIDSEDVEELEFKQDSMNLKINKNGFVIENKGENLQTVLADFITEVSKIIVIQGTSPNVPALTQISERLKKVLK